ncbi:CBS domain-containing protein [Aquicoccus porphyridii]|uniref:CBS domain-containing protein n=1 Tax=Aquicoccus porphyridii TaxID=1852029 RepID=A0A5A9ZVH2_9RHOB|nr:CBS domain-containing protein [Aquicoccus porphyridii]KAA0920685.1 CBS domain-containing protein [Aquicoccus porphyridii]RAI56762.1 histidine kinase [Rhodobacteraceae bacterium AsT-22]
MLVHQILKSKGDHSVITVEPGTSVAEAAQILAERRIGGVIVSKDGRQADGILSERDIVRSLALRGAVCLSETVDQMMTRNPVSCTKSETADSVLERMTNGRFRHMPVVEGEDLVGIVTIGDVVKARLEELSMEKDALEGMIMGH